MHISEDADFPYRMFVVQASYPRPSWWPTRNSTVIKKGMVAEQHREPPFCSSWPGTLSSDGFCRRCQISASTRDMSNSTCQLLDNRATLSLVIPLQKTLQADQKTLSTRRSGLWISQISAKNKSGHPSAAANVTSRVG